MDLVYSIFFASSILINIVAIVAVVYDWKMSDEILDEALKILSEVEEDTKGCFLASRIQKRLINTQKGKRAFLGRRKLPEGASDAA